MYQNWLKSKISLSVLIFLLLLSFLGLLFIEKNRKKVKYPAYEKQVEASQQMQLALKTIKRKRLELGININRQIDPNQTGIIGKELTPITTSLGNLASKRTATNPDFSALMVRYFNELKLQKNDVVAVGASGSFPSLIIATLVAAETMELNPVVIYSIGSSMYGANIPDFTFIEMLKDLNKKNILNKSLIAVSLGGNNDRAEALFFPEDREVFLEIAEKVDVPFIYEDTLAESIEKRLELYNSVSGKEIKCFVNIGGASANYGNSNVSLNFPSGLVNNPPSIPAGKERGLIYEYSARGIPVINLLNIRGLAHSEGLAVDPVPLPEPGRSDVYYEVNYNKYLISILLGIILLILIMSYKKYDARN